MPKSGGPDVKKAETRNRETKSFKVKIPSASPPAYPVTNATTGTINFKPTGHKYGAKSLFDGTQYITIPHHVNFDLVGPDFGWIIFFKTTTGGTYGLYCKKNVAVATNAGMEIYVESTQADQYGASTEYDSTNFQQSAVNNSITCIIADGTNSVTLTQTTATNIFDGSWHSIAVNASGSVDYDSANYDSNYAITSSETLEIYLDKVSIGSTSTTSITGNLSNTRDCIFAGRDNAGTIQDKLRGSVAYWFYENTGFTSAEITDYHDNALIITDDQKNAIMFTGNEGVSTNDKIK